MINLNIDKQSNYSFCNIRIFWQIKKNISSFKEKTSQSLIRLLAALIYLLHLFPLIEISIANNAQHSRKLSSSSVSV